MLGLVAAQLKFKVDDRQLKAGEAVWVDVSCLPILRISISRTRADPSDWWGNRVSIDDIRIH